jgi:hypothetical protein
VAIDDDVRSPGILEADPGAVFHLMRWIRRTNAADFVVAHP